MILALWWLGCVHPLPQGPVDATVTGEAMGGELRIVVRCESAAAHADCLADGLAARARIERLHALATDWTPSGEIAQLNAASGTAPVTVSPDIAAMLQASLRMSATTEGAFDPTVGAFWGLWDFKLGKIPSDAALVAAVSRVDWHQLHIDGDQASLDQPHMAVTLGGIAQGYAAGAALGDISGGREALIDLSGDLAARGAWSVGLQNPRAARGVTFGSVTLVDAALTTSGDYESAFILDGVRYHHILDPHTGRPATGAISATVVCVDAAVADGLATALVVLGPRDDVVRALDAWAVVVTADGVVHELGERAHVVDVKLPDHISVD